MQMTKTGILLVIVVTAALVLSALTVLLIAIPSTPGTYAGSLGVDPVDYRPSSYGGVSAPGGGRFMVLNVTFSNTGTLDVNFNRTSWAMRDPSGVFLDLPSPLFNVSLHAPAQRATRGTIVFNDWSSSVAQLSVALPDGKRIVTLLTTTLDMSVNVGVSGDGTNWTLLVVSIPLALLKTDTNLMINGSAGTVLLPPTSFAGLDYSIHHAAYISAGGPTYTQIVVGDRLLISTATYPSGSQLEISSQTKVWFTGTLA